MASLDILSSTSNPRRDDRLEHVTFGRLLGRIWGRVSGVSSAVGLASFFNDLQAWIDFFRWMLAQIAPLFAMLIESIWQVLVALVGLYQHFIYPLIDALFSWLPFTLPDPVRDGIFISIFSLGWALRYRRGAIRPFIALQESLPRRAGRVSARAKQLAPEQLRDRPDAEIRAWYRAQLAQAPKNLLFGMMGVFGTVALTLIGLWVLDFIYRTLA